MSRGISEVQTGVLTGRMMVRKDCEAIFTDAAIIQEVDRQFELEQYKLSRIQISIAAAFRKEMRAKRFPQHQADRKGDQRQADHLFLLMLHQTGSLKSRKER